MPADIGDLDNDENVGGRLRGLEETVRAQAQRIAELELDAASRASGAEPSAGGGPGGDDGLSETNRLLERIADKLDDIESEIDRGGGFDPGL